MPNPTYLRQFDFCFVVDQKFGNSSNVILQKKSRKRKEVIDELSQSFPKQSRTGKHVTYKLVPVTSSMVI